MQAAPYSLLMTYGGGIISRDHGANWPPKNPRGRSHMQGQSAGKNSPYLIARGTNGSSETRHQKLQADSIPSSVTRLVQQSWDCVSDAANSVVITSTTRHRGLAKGRDPVAGMTGVEASALLSHDAAHLHDWVLPLRLPFPALNRL